MTHSLATTVWLFVALAAALATDDTSDREDAALAAAAERVAASIVEIETLGGLEQGKVELTATGRSSGVVVTSDGYIVTSLFPFTTEPNGVLVTLADGTRVAAKLVARDFRCRLALLKLNVDEPLRVPAAAAVKDLRVGQWAVAVGRGLEADRPNVSVGIVSGLNRVWGSAVQTDAKISPNNYGGALVDIHGRVIGVLAPLKPERQDVAADVQWYDSGIGFAVPLEQIMPLLPRWQRGGDFRNGVIGIGIKPGNLYSEAPVVGSVRPASPAAKSGIRAGDTIVEVDGRPIARTIDLSAAINRRYAGDTLQFKVRRGQETLARDVAIVDELSPYSRPLLGVLAARNDDGQAGALVRFVYPDSPAARAGIKSGDRLMTFQGEAIAGRIELATLVGAAAIKDKVAIEIDRDGRRVPLEVTLSADVETVPESLPALPDAPAPAAADQPAVGVLPLNSAVVQNDGALFVPDEFDAKQGYGLLIWLHGDDGVTVESLVERWRDLCTKNRLLLLVPVSASKKRWAPTDFETITTLLDQTLADYAIDPLRVAVHAQQSGGVIGAALAFRRREQIRGLAMIQSPLTLAPPENDPDYRLSVYFASANVPTLMPQVKRLRELRYPVVERKLDDKASYLNDVQLAEFLRWLDTLDRI
jgi:serine protease Do